MSRLFAWSLGGAVGLALHALDQPPVQRSECQSARHQIVECDPSVPLADDVAVVIPLHVRSTHAARLVARCRTGGPLRCDLTRAGLPRDTVTVVAGGETEFSVRLAPRSAADTGRGKPLPADTTLPRRAVALDLVDLTTGERLRTVLRPTDKTTDPAPGDFSRAGPPRSRKTSTAYVRPRSSGDTLRLAPGRAAQAAFVVAFDGDDSATVSVRLDARCGGAARDCPATLGPITLGGAASGRSSTAEVIVPFRLAARVVDADAGRVTLRAAFGDDSIDAVVAGGARERAATVFAAPVRSVRTTLRADPATLVLAAGDSVQAEFVLRNDGTGPTSYAVVARCDGITLAGCHTTFSVPPVAPGDSVRLAVPVAAESAAAPGAAGRLLVDVLPSYADRCVRATVPVRVGSPDATRRPSRVGGAVIRDGAPSLEARVRRDYCQRKTAAAP